MSNQPIRVGVIGLGFGKEHLIRYNMLEGVEIACVCDCNPQLLEETAKRYKAKPYTSAEKMLKDEKLDGVSICTPPSQHCQEVKIAAERGIHVLCEKPMAPTIKDCEEMIEACQKNGVKLMLGFKKRFAPAYVALKERIKEQLGNPYWLFYRYTIYPSHHLEKDWFWDENDGGGALGENVGHATDIVRYLMGDEVERVYAEGGNYITSDKPSSDSAVITLRFKNGGIVSIGVGFSSDIFFATESLTIHSEKGVAEVFGRTDFPNTLKLTLRDTARIEEEQFAEHPGVMMPSSGLVEGSSGLNDEIKHFVECIRRKELQPRVNGIDGKKAVEICLAAKESIKKGKPIEIS